VLGINFKMRTQTSAQLTIPTCVALPFFQILIQLKMLIKGQKFGYFISPPHVLNNSPYLTNRFTDNHIRYLVSVEIS
jgi:hypothetical protein